MEKESWKMKVFCDNCGREMKECGDRSRFETIYRCLKCGCQVTVDWRDIGYELIEEYPRDRK